MKTRQLLLGIPLIVLATVFCSVIPATPAAPTADVGAAVSATLTALAPTEGPFMPPQTGTISGELSYPSEGIPPLRVVAFDVHSSLYYYVDTVQNQRRYTIENVYAGTYHVVAYVLNPAYALAGGYTQAVLCGLLYTCEDHTLIDVIVVGGQATTGVNPGDWYAPEGAFPPMPNP